MAEEDTFWAVCTDLHVPAENPDLLSCEGGLLQIFHEQMTVSWPSQTEAILHVPTVAMELNAKCLPDDATLIKLSLILSDASWHCLVP